MLGDGWFKIEFQRPQTAADRGAPVPGAEASVWCDRFHLERRVVWRPPNAGCFMLDCVGVPIPEVALTHE